ncbi:MAG: CDP-diacylglycerol--serine O-phosphatidyltransferase [Alphaproteobacteria bacterium]
MRPRRLRPPPINLLVPNGVTVLGICAGLTSIRFAFLGRFEAAAIALLLAMICDALDGRLARLLRATSEFGVQLDSLADIVNFGVAPAIVLHIWVLSEIRGAGWAVVLFFAVCCALRLARFNVGATSAEAEPATSSRFFTGMPAPAGCGVVLLPLLLSFELGEGWWTHPLVVGAHVLVVAFLMVSRVPTFSFKAVRLKHEHVLPAMVLLAMLAALSVAYIWWVLLAVEVFYVASLPWGLRAYARDQAAPPAEADDEDEEDEEDAE